MPFNLRSHYLYTATSAQPPALSVCSNYGSRLGGGRMQTWYLSPTSSPAIGFVFISSLFGVCAPWCGEVKIQFLERRGRESARARAGAGASAPNRYPHALNAWRKPNSRRSLTDGEEVLAGRHRQEHSQPRARNLCPQNASARAALRRDAEGTPGDGDARSTDENRLQLGDVVGLRAGPARAAR